MIFEKLPMFCFHALISLVFASSSLLASNLPLEEKRGKFKIGFEFQEINHLCKEASENFQVQKKPIFRLKKGERVLWTLEIDTKDLEFITEPFSNEEPELLQEAIETIQIACEVLQNIRKRKKAEDPIFFKEWVEDQVGGNVRIGLTDKNNNEAVQKKLEELQKKKQGLKTRLNDPVKNRVLEIDKKIFDLVSDIKIDITTVWKPKFQPQVTIQHPLEKTIPLVVNLFGPEKRLLIDIEALSALPYSYRTTYSNNNQEQKIPSVTSKP